MVCGPANLIEFYEIFPGNISAWLRNTDKEIHKLSSFRQNSVRTFRGKEQGRKQKCRLQLAFAKEQNAK